MKDKKMLKGVVLALLVFTVVAGILGINVRAGSKGRTFSEETDAAEIDFRSEVKEVLATVGAKNAGITMTKICEDGMTINYDVVINLPYYINLDYEEEEKLIGDLRMLTPEVDDCTVEFSFSRKEDT